MYFNTRNRYRFGFNGQENDNEVKGGGGQQDNGMRIYDTRLGKFLSADPLIVYGQKYPELSTYQFACNTPIMAIDLDELEAFIKLSVQNKEGKLTTLHVFKWSDIHPNQKHGPWGDKGAITYTYLYQQRTKDTRYLDYTTEYSVNINGKTKDVKSRSNVMFREKSAWEKFSEWDDSFDKGKHGANGGGLGDEQDTQVAIAMVSLVVTAGLANYGISAYELVTVFFDADQLTTDSKGSTSFEKNILNDNKLMKTGYNFVKLGFSVQGKYKNILDFGSKGNHIVKTTIQNFSSSVSVANESVSTAKSIEELKSDQTNKKTK